MKKILLLGTLIFLSVPVFVSASYYNYDTNQTQSSWCYNCAYRTDPKPEEYHSYGSLYWNDYNDPACIHHMCTKKYYYSTEPETIDESELTCISVYCDKSSKRFNQEKCIKACGSYAYKILGIKDPNAKSKEPVRKQETKETTPASNETAKPVETEQPQENIQKTEQNKVEPPKDLIVDEKKTINPNASPAEQRRSQVANAVHVLLQVADREGGIGQQVKIIAQNQNENQNKLEQSIETIQSRGEVTKFFLGSDYGQIRKVQQTLDQNRSQISILNQLKNQIKNPDYQSLLTEKIKILEQTNQEIEALLLQSESGFSLFGWVNKIFN